MTCTLSPWASHLEGELYWLQGQGYREGACLLHMAEHVCPSLPMAVWEREGAPWECGIQMKTQKGSPGSP